jgi:hypothetical protein
MKVSAVFAGLLSLAASAYAADPEWVNLGKAGSFTAYIDTANISMRGERRWAWTRHDYDYPRFNVNIPRPYLSIRSQSLFDCVGQRWGILYTAYFSKAALAGEEVWSSDAMRDEASVNWQPAAPGTLAGGYLEAACSENSR